jgi:hypothetical protein
MSAILRWLGRPARPLSHRTCARQMREQFGRAEGCDYRKEHLLP